jgi:hypothetical protein
MQYLLMYTHPCDLFSLFVIIGNNICLRASSGCSELIIFLRNFRVLILERRWMLSKFAWLRKVPWSASNGNR